MNDPRDSNSSDEPELGPCVEIVMPAPAYEEFVTSDESDAAIDPSIAPPAATSAMIEIVPPSFDAAPILGAIASLNTTLGGKLDQLRASFDREIRAETTRERVVDRLHAELQEYKQDLLMKVMKPVFIDLIQLHDDMGKIVESCLREGEPSPETAHWVDVVNGLRQGIEDVLYRQGVEPFSAEDSAFDAHRQRSIATIPTEDATMSKMIAVRHRKGFQSGDKVIRPELVSVFSLKAVPR